jgi:hypothetical protein
MEIEERDFYKDVDTADDFRLSSSSGLRDLSLPTLPQSYRIHEVKVVLSNGPKYCLRSGTGGGFRHSLGIDSRGGGSGTPSRHWKRSLSIFSAKKALVMN